MPRPICVKCSREMPMAQMGIAVLFTAKFGHELERKQQPYKMHSGDRYKCDTCGAEVVVYNPKPYWERHQTSLMPVPDITVKE